MNKEKENFNFITTRDLFKSYPYKMNKKGLAPGTISVPYIKKTDIVNDHKYSIDFNTYRQVIERYFELLIDDLLQGEIYRLPFYLGIFRLMKYRSRYKIFKVVDDVKKAVMVRDPLNDSVVLLRWIRRDKFSFKYHNYWRFMFSRGFKLKLTKALNDKPELIYKYINT